MSWAPIEKGDPVLVLYRGLARHAHVHATYATELSVQLALADGPILRVHRAEEGISWCQGHDGDAAKALQVAHALRSTP